MSAGFSDPSNKTLRVLMTTDAVGGVWRYSVDLIAGLAERGGRVLLANMGPAPSNEQKRQAFDIPGLFPAESNFALEWMQDPWSEVDSAGKWLLEIEANFGADIIHLNGYAHAALNWQKPVVVMAHSCVNSWWRAVHGSAPGSEWNEYSRRVRAGLAAADAIVAPSASMAAALEHEYSIAAGNIHVIHNFCTARRNAGVQKEPFILAAGRIWDEAKNIGLLNSVAPQLNWEIRVAGNNLEAESSRIRSQMVRLLGPLPHPELLRLMDRARIFAHPTLYEPFGLSVLEAARASCCLVLSDIPSLRELWDGAAVFVNPRDAERWAFELDMLIRDPAKCGIFGRLAYSRAGKYEAAQSVSSYLSLYRSLLESPRRARKETAA